MAHDDPANPYYHEALNRGVRVDELAAKSARVANAKKSPRWVGRSGQNAGDDRLTQWSKASPEERARLEEGWADEDAAALAAKKKARADEEDRRRRVTEARERLRGAG